MNRKRRRGWFFSYTFRMFRKSGDRQTSLEPRHKIVNRLLAEATGPGRVNRRRSLLSAMPENEFLPRPPCLQSRRRVRRPSAIGGHDGVLYNILCYYITFSVDIMGFILFSIDRDNRPKTAAASAVNSDVARISYVYIYTIYL